VAVVQYTFTHKQYIEQHNYLIGKSVDCAPSLQVIPWQLPLQLKKKHGKTSVSGSDPVEAIGILKMVQQHTTASC